MDDRGRKFRTLTYLEDLKRVILLKRFEVAMAYTLVKTYLEVFEGFNLLGRFVEVKLTKILGGVNIPGRF